MMRLRKILCPTDFSPGAERAMRVAARLATESDAELVLTHSWYLPPMAVADFSFPETWIQQISDDAARALARAVTDLGALGVKRVSSKLLTGPPWAQIVELARRDDAFDLIVIGTHGRTGLKRFLLGSIAEQVIRHAPCSVLAVRPDGELKPFRHALCPTDFSESARHAVQLASELIPADGEITLLHVIEVIATYSGEMPFGLDRDLDRRASDMLDETAMRLRGTSATKVTTRSRLGYPGGETLAALDADPTIDLVVMGSQGRTGISRAILGSVAEKVARHARCPVLVARCRTRA